MRDPRPSLLSAIVPCFNERATVAGSYEIVADLATRDVLSADIVAVAMKPDKSGHRQSRGVRVKGHRREQRVTNRQSFFSWLQSSRGLWLTGVLVCGGYLAAGWVTNHPFVNDVSPELSAGDDWLSYQQYAISILDGGLTIPAVKGAYYTPGGFLYNYFVAAVFAVAGRNAAFVYFVQAVIIGVGLFLNYLTFRRELPPIVAALFLATAARLVYVDLYRQWGRRLLSESLAFSLTAVALWLLILAWRTERIGLYAACGTAFGLLVLARQNLALIPFGMAGLIMIYSRFRGRAFLRAIVFLACACVVISILGFRNAVVTGEFQFSPTYSGLLPPPESSDALLKVFAIRALACVGILIDPDGPQMVIKGHWLVQWIGVAGLVVISAFRRRLEFVDAMCLAFIALAFAPFVVMPQLGGYGMRFQLPYEPLVLFLAFRFGAACWEAIRRRRVTEPRPA